MEPDIASDLRVCTSVRVDVCNAGAEDSSHNPEVAGSNPAPATENVQVRAMINFMALTAFKIIPEPFQK